MKAKLHQRSDHLQTDRLLGRSATSSYLVAKMKPSWTSEMSPSTQSGTKYDLNIRRQEVRPLQIEVDGPKRSRAKKSRILKSKREIETRTERRAEGKQRKWQNKMPNTTPRGHCIRWITKGQRSSSGEACAFKRDKNKKAKGRDHFVHLLRRVHRTEVRKVTEKVVMTEVLKRHQNLLVKVRQG